MVRMVSGKGGLRIRINYSEDIIFAAEETVKLKVNMTSVEVGRCYLEIYVVFLGWCYNVLFKTGHILDLNDLETFKMAAKGVKMH